MIVPIVLGAGALGLYFLNKNKKAAAYSAPAMQASSVPAGFSPVPVAPVATVAATQAPAGFAPGAASSEPTATYTVVARDNLQFVARRFTFDMKEWLAANPGFYDGTDKDYNTPGPNQARNAQYYSPTGSGFKNIALVQSKFFPVGKKYNLPPGSMDNGPREMAMGTPVGFVATGITKEMVPNAPGVTDVQSTLIRETLAANQKAGKTAAQTSQDIGYWLKNITR